MDFDIFRWGHYLNVFKFYALIMTIFWVKGGIVFKGGHYIREDIIQGNTVYRYISLGIIYLNTSHKFSCNFSA